MELFQIGIYKTFTEKPMDASELFFLHTHNNYEIYCFLSGNGQYSAEGTIYDMSPGDVVLLRNMEAHLFIPKKNVPYKRIYLNFQPGPDLDSDFINSLLTPFLDRSTGSYNHYSASQFPNNHWQFYLDSIYEANDPIKRQIYLAALLQEFRDCFTIMKARRLTSPPNSITNITQYIDNHLSSPLSLEQICHLFGTSVSQLNRNFKAVLGTTVGNYILTKRLLKAQSMIQQGKKPTHIYTQCGFQDYSAFFRAYRKYWGYNPSEDIN